MVKSLSFSEAVLATAKQKAEAAKSRSTEIAAKKPKEVILSACEAIAAALKPDGFAYAKSGPKLKRMQGDLTFTIMFQSDRNNVAGRRAAVWIHAGVSSEKLAQVRRSDPMPWGGDAGPGAGTVTGGQIGNLLAKPTWMEWDFADVETRQSEIDDAIAAIRRIILPFFALFDAPQNAVVQLLDRHALWPGALIQYAGAVVGLHAAEAAGHTFLKCNPFIRERFREALAKFKQDGLPTYRSDTGGDLAAIAIAGGLDFLASE